MREQGPRGSVRCLFHDPDPSDLTNRICNICGNPPVERPTEHFYVSLSHFQAELADDLSNAQGWRDNAVHMTRRYLEEGLQDRAATRI